MKAPQIIYVGILTLNLGIALAKHGEAKNEEYNFFSTLFSVSFTVALLVWGGFFN